MKRWIYSGVLVTLLFVLIACGKTPVENDAYTKDAQVEKASEEIQDETNTEDSESEDEAVKEEATDKQDSADKKSSDEEDVPTQSGSGVVSDSTPPTTKEEPPVENERISRVTISIDTKTLLNNMDKVAENKKAYVPSDGWILAPITVDIQEGETVFDVLSRVTRDRRIHMEYQGANQNIHNSVYIQGIGQLYEFDGGELSGWMYTIDGAYVPKGASSVVVEDGMRIEWRYTCDLGRDLGI